MKWCFDIDLESYRRLSSFRIETSSVLLETMQIRYFDWNWGVSFSMALSSRCAVERDVILAHDESLLAVVYRKVPQ